MKRREWAPGDIARLDYLGWDHPLDRDLVRIVAFKEGLPPYYLVRPLDVNKQTDSDWPIIADNLSQVHPLEVLAEQAE